LWRVRSHLDESGRGPTLALCVMSGRVLVSSGCVREARAAEAAWRVRDAQGDFDPTGGEH